MLPFHRAGVRCSAECQWPGIGVLVSGRRPGAAVAAQAALHRGSNNPDSATVSGHRLAVPNVLRLPAGYRRRTVSMGG